MTFDDQFGIALYLLGGCVTVLISDPYFRRANADKSEKNIEGYSEVFLFMLTATLWPMIAAYVIGGWFGQKMNETDAADADGADDDDHGPGKEEPSCGRHDRQDDEHEGGHMNATEARQRSANAALNLEVERQLEDVLKRIRTAADAGLYRVGIVGGRLNPHVVTRLLSLGYEESYNATNTNYVHTISWALAKGEPTSSDAKTPPAALAKTLDRSHLAKLHDSALFLGEPACSSFRDLIASHLAVLDLTFEQARSLAGYMNRYKGPGQQTFDVCLAEPIEFALDGTVTGGTS